MCRGFVFPPGLFYRDLLQLSLSDSGVLVLDTSQVPDVLGLEDSSDLPRLPLPLSPLLLPAHSLLSPEPVVAPSAVVSPDLSREGPFDASQGTSVSGLPPLSSIVCRGASTG